MTSEASETSGDRGRLLVRWGLRLIGPILLLVVIARLEEPEAILATLRRADPWLLGAAFALSLVAIHMKVVRWQWLLRRRSISYPAGRAWAAFLGSTYIGMLTPGRVGDVLRVSYLRHDRGVPLSEGLASVVMDRLCDLYVLGLFVAYGVLRFAPVLRGELGYAAWVGLAGVVLLPALLFIPGLLDRSLSRLASRLSRQHGAAGTERFLVAIRAQLGAALIPILVLTGATFGVNYVQGYLMARSLGLEIAMVDIVGLLAISSLLGLLPISVSGLGLRELFFALAFPLLGLSAASGVTFGLLVFAALNLLLVVLGLISFQIAPPPVRPREGDEPRQERLQ